MTYRETRALLKEKGQEQVLRFYGELGEKERAELLRRIGEIDWSLLERLHSASGEERRSISPIGGLTLPEIAAQKNIFRAAGERAIAEGKVAGVLLAGGQGTRLGWDAPKGTFDIGLSRPLYIFECLFRNLMEVTERVGANVPLFIMTSEKNDAATRSFLKEHGYFGYPEQFVRFFRQDMAPAVDFDGKLLLEGKGSLALSPNGNGGWYSSLARTNILPEFPEVEWLNVFAVDNVLQRIADPAFIGATLLSGKPCGAKVVSKAEPHEKVGVLCLENGVPDVIEYYELTEEMANARDSSGALLYRFGVILNYLFRVRELKEIASVHIPVHIVKKKIPFLGEEGTLIRPEEVNGYKFEELILDMIKLMGSCQPYEVVREREFAPIKNMTGIDSVESARALLEENGVIL